MPTIVSGTSLTISELPTAAGLASEGSLPERRADQRDRLRAGGGVLALGEQAARDRLHPQRLEVSARDRLAVDVRGLAAAADGEQRTRERSDASRTTSPPARAP